MLRGKKTMQIRFIIACSHSYIESRVCVGHESRKGSMEEKIRSKVGRTREKWDICDIKGKE